MLSRYYDPTCETIHQHASIDTWNVRSIHLIKINAINTYTTHPEHSKTFVVWVSHTELPDFRVPVKNSQRTSQVKEIPKRPAG